MKYLATIFIILFLLMVIIIFKQYKSYFNKVNKNAIVVLTKGYDTIDKYRQLIDRNNSIYDKFYRFIDSSGYDIIIFHEGNITTEQQEYIQSQTPGFPLIFKTVPFLLKSGTNMEVCQNTELSEQFTNGYKNMCYFWSISFMKYLKDYEYIIRIDEDCIINHLDINIINTYKNNNIVFSSAFYQQDDDPGVVVGMKYLFDNYLTKNNLSQKNQLSMPYTNFMIVNIPYLQNNNDVINILNEIDKSDCIFSNRWGDLPIWGYILSYFIDKEKYIEDKNISYIHGSHSKQIN